MAGARASTVGYLSGLDRWALRRYFVFDADDAPRPGKRPDSPERFVKNATLFTMIDASLAYAIYRDHRERWPHPAEALLAAYAHYVRRRVPNELSFDRVFYVIAWTDRLWPWAGRDAAFRCTVCGHCHCRYLTSPAATDNHRRDCPFCKLAWRYRRDPRVANRFPEREYPRVRTTLAGTRPRADGSDDLG